MLNNCLGKYCYENFKYMKKKNLFRNNVCQVKP